MDLPFRINWKPIPNQDSSTQRGCCKAQRKFYTLSVLGNGRVSLFYFQGQSNTFKTIKVRSKYSANNLVMPLCRILSFKTAKTSRFLDCILDSFINFEGYSFSSKEFLLTAVDIMVIWINSPIPVHFSSLIPKMSMFTLGISCLATSNLPWFMDLTFQVPMQHYSL